jgi:hypothetical protein
VSIESGLIKVFTKGAKGAKAAPKAPPFYSAVDNAVDMLPNKATPEQMIKELLKQKEVKAQELIDRGIDKKLGVPIVQKERTVKLKKPDAKGNTEKVEKYFEVTPGEKGAKAITKDEVINTVEQNPPKQITEETPGGISKSMIDDKIYDLIEAETRKELGPRPKLGYEREDWLEDFDRLIEEKSLRKDDYYQEAKETLMEEGNVGDAAYDRPDLKLPGGENYREILLKLPTFDPNKEKQLMELEANLRRMNPVNFPPGYLDSMKDGVVKLKAEKESFGKEYKSSHWTQPNVLAHMRVQDRVGPNGEKVLHVEEIQSDWHQAGRQKGYKGSPSEKAINAGIEQAKKLGYGQQQIDGMSPEQLAHFTALGSNSVPDAPFKKNWHELAMKRLINYASENGYDKIAITPGAEQAKRYDLSKQISGISWNKRSDGLYNIEADTLRGEPIVKKNLTEQELEDTVGKEVASKIVGGVGQLEKDPLFDSGKLTRGRLENLDLKVGGEGMKGFYDQMLPAYLNKYGEKHGAKVSPIEVTRPPRDSTLAFGYPGGEDYVAGKITWNEFLQQSPHAAKEFSTQLHGFDITPSMREEVLTKGQPLYQQVGIPAATGAAGAEMLGAEMPEEPGFAEGGAVNENTVPDMSDGGNILQGPPFKRGGKVSISNNPDAMFLELNDKKFRRK